MKYGEGDSCDIAQYDTMYRMLDEYPAKWFNTGFPAPGEAVPDRAGNKGVACCMAFYTTKDGGSIYVTMTGVGPVQRGYPIIGMLREDYPDTCTGFPIDTPMGQKAEALITKWCAEHTIEEVERIFNENASPCQRAYGPAEILADEQYDARENIVEWEDAVYGPMKGIGVTNRFKKNPSKIFASAPTLGEHNREIFTAWGLTNDEIDDMYDTGEISTWDAATTAKRKFLKEWGYFWDPERQCKRLGIE